MNPAEIASILVFSIDEMSAAKGITLMGCLSEIDDARRPSNGTLHDLRKILVMAIAGALSDSDTVEDIAHWARMREARLRRFLVLKNGVPSGRHQLLK